MSAAYAQIGNWLGLQGIQQDASVLRAVEERLPTSLIQRLGDLGLDRNEIYAVVIPARTLTHRKSRREKLTVEESDRVLRLLRVMAEAGAVYGSHEAGLDWLRQANPRLENRTPLSLLKTDTGSRMVEDLLVQIDEGMFV